MTPIKIKAIPFKLNEDYFSRLRNDWSLTMSAVNYSTLPLCSALLQLLTVLIGFSQHIPFHKEKTGLQK